MRGSSSPDGYAAFASSDQLVVLFFAELRGDGVGDAVLVQDAFERRDRLAGLRTVGLIHNHREAFARGVQRQRLRPSSPGCGSPG